MSKKCLIILESPSKVKYLEKYLSNTEYIITSSCGHVTEIPKKKLGIDLQTYTIKKIASKLRK
jgi:DNA topoisomerase-1